jgi:myo-inositol-1(or 4)-monophosphatase
VSYVVPLEILREACVNVYNRTRNIIGTQEGNRRLGIGAGGDWSRKIDVEAEEAVISTVKKYGLCPTIIGEECGKIPGQDGFLVIDPIDGTTNASVGLPFYCSSLAYASEYKLSAVMHATVMDLFRGEIYSASRNKGAYLNEVKINVNKDRQYDELIIGMNVSRTSSEDIDTLSRVLGLSDHIRLFGANALELCYLAKGSLDAYIDFRGKIRATDMAAAYLIVREAGGIIYSASEQVLDTDLGVDSRMSFVAVKNDKVHDFIFEALRIKKRK